MDELLTELRTFDALRDSPSDGEGRADIVLTRVLPSQAPDLAPAQYLDRLPPPMKQALAAQGITALYAHQAEAVDRIRGGEDVVLEVPARTV